MLFFKKSNNAKVIEELKEIFQDLKSSFVKLKNNPADNIDSPSIRYSKSRLETIKKENSEHLSRKAKKWLMDCETALEAYDKEYEKALIKLGNNDSLGRNLNEFDENDLTRDWNSRIEAINELINSLKLSNGNQGEWVRLSLIVERIKQSLKTLTSKNHKEFTNKEKLEEEEIEKILSGIEMEYPELYIQLGQP